jgi:hypothetical protein
LDIYTEFLLCDVTSPDLVRDRNQRSVRFAGLDRGSFGMDCRFCEGPHSACELAQRDWLNRYNEGDDVEICQWAPEVLSIE